MSCDTIASNFSSAQRNIVTKLLAFMFKEEDCFNVLYVNTKMQMVDINVILCKEE